MDMSRKEAEGILDEMMGVDDKPACPRCTALESALRKVDEIRHAMKPYETTDGTIGKLILALKAPCMVVYK